MRILILLLISAFSSFGQAFHISDPAFIAQQATASGGGTVNNVALVAGHLGGDGGGNVATLAFNLGGNSVTSGNTVIVGIAANNAGLAPTTGMLTKTAGTSTIGTVALDATTNDTHNVLIIYRVPITGNGTLTLTFNPAVTIYQLGGAAEFTGIATSPLGPAGFNGSTGTSHTTGSISTSTPGMIFYVASEIAAGDFTRTYSDQLIFKVDTGNSTYTGITQYKIVNSSPNTLTDTTGADSSTWVVCYAEYKTN